MEKMLEFNESEHKDWHILSAIGRIDTVTATEAEKFCFDTLTKNNKIAFDLSALNYISSAGLRVLLRLAKQAKRNKKTFVFFGASGMIKEVFEASGMDMLVTIYDSADDLP